MNDQVLGTIIFVVGSFIAVFVAIFLTDIIKQRLSFHTRLALGQFARMAVLQVELSNPEMSIPAKKQLAILAVTTLFKIFHLPSLDQEAIGIAIEAEMYLLSKTVVVSSSPPSLPEMTKADE
jgi:hypothetical protein